MSGVAERPSDPWSFMLRFYALPGIAAACLRLQDAHDLDVPFFLALLHAQASGHSLDRDTVHQLDRECATWRDEVIHPLRAVRTAMKSDPWTTRDPQVSELRAAIKSQELRAERIEVEMLARLMADLPSAAPCHDPAKLCEVARLVLDCQALSPPETLPADARLVAEAVAGFLAA
jgi:uncharacterized protein (TIGR02444 family)